MENQKNKGFWVPEKRKLVLFLCLIAVSLVMYIPPLYHLQTANGTAVQFIWAMCVMLAAPVLSLVDTLMTKN